MLIELLNIFRNDFVGWFRQQNSKSDSHNVNWIKGYCSRKVLLNYLNILSTGLPSQMYQYFLQQSISCARRYLILCCINRRKQFAQLEPQCCHLQGRYWELRMVKFDHFFKILVFPCYKLAIKGVLRLSRCSLKQNMRIRTFFWQLFSTFISKIKQIFSPISNYGIFIQYQLKYRELGSDCLELWFDVRVDQIQVVGGVRGGKGGARLQNSKVMNSMGQTLFLIVEGIKQWISVSVVIKILYALNLFNLHMINQNIYKINMFKYLIAALLLSVTLQQTLFLTPTYPPSAFFQQYYEVRFRVRGLEGPSFTFENLPNFLSGSADGVLSGTPNVTGTFRINIAYTDGTNSGSSKVVVNVIGSPNTDASAKQSAEVTFLVIQNAINSWIYRTGDDISIQLSCANGAAPIVWDYQNLPKGLSGDNHGLIKGSLAESGLYSFSASAGDAKGLRAESYYTLNIQPGTIIKTNNILNVPDRNVPFVYDISQVEAQQIAADKAVTKALANVAEAKAAAQAVQGSQGKTQIAVNLATDQENAAEVTFSKAQDIYNAAVNTHYIAQANLNTAKNAVAIFTTNLKNANAVLAAAEANLAAAKAIFDKATEAFNAANAAATKAVNELTQAQADYNTAVANVKDAQNAYNIAWTNVQVAKEELNEANNRLLQANAAVVNAKNAVGLATQANDDAQANLNVADAALTAAQHALEDANAAVAEITVKFDAAKSALGVAKFSYTQALNSLYVAQAAKEASDKAIAIAYAQGAAATDIFKGESTYIFNGCLNQAYPSIGGTVSVVGLIPNGAQLSSGHVLTWGDCTTKENVNIGDVIQYQGNIVGGCISATSIKRRA